MNAANYYESLMNNPIVHVLHGYSGTLTGLPVFDQLWMG